MTKESAQTLELAAADEVTAVIKVTEVMTGMRERRHDRRGQERPSKELPVARATQPELSQRR
jgi:hypothetical protein